MIKIIAGIGVAIALYLLAFRWALGPRLPLAICICTECDCERPVRVAGAVCAPCQGHFREAA